MMLPQKASSRGETTYSGKFVPSFGMQCGGRIHHPMCYGWPCHYPGLAAARETILRKFDRNTTGYCVLDGE